MNPVNAMIALNILNTQIPMNAMISLYGKNLLDAMDYVNAVNPENTMISQNSIDVVLSVKEANELDNVKQLN